MPMVFTWGDYPADPAPSFTFTEPIQAAQFAWSNLGGQGFQIKPWAVQVCVMLPVDVTDCFSSWLPSNLPPVVVPLPQHIEQSSIVKRRGGGLPVYSSSWTAQQLLQNLDMTMETHDIWQDIHLTRDSRLTIPTFGFAQVVTTDAGISDFLGFCELTIYSQQGAATALHRSAPGCDWHVVGTTSGDPEDVELLCADDLPREGQLGYPAQGYGVVPMQADALTQPWVWAAAEAASYASISQPVIGPPIRATDKGPKLLWEVPLEEVVAVGGGQWQPAQRGGKSMHVSEQGHQVPLLQRQQPQSPACLLAAKLSWLLQCRARLYSTQPTSMCVLNAAPFPASSPLASL